MDRFKYEQAVKVIEGWNKPELQDCIKEINASLNQNAKLKTKGTKQQLISTLFNQLQITSKDIKKRNQLLDYGKNQQEALVEFPNICLIRVNKTNIETNLKGIKNRPGTVHPQDITKFCRLDISYENKIEFYYENTSKKYILVLNLVKRVPVEGIVDTIKNGKYISKENVLKKIKQSLQDSEVVATSSLSHCRITLPCRSNQCNHVQCFDAYSFFKMNEQIPTWTCPICYRILDSWEDIVVDGQESVTIEADGSWIKSKRSHKNDASLAMVSPVKKTKLNQSRKQVYAIDSSDSENDSSDMDLESTDSSNNNKILNNSNVSTGPVFIDLTQSSDEETDDKMTRTNKHVLLNAPPKSNSKTIAKLFNTTTAATKLELPLPPLPSIF
nr:3955_t:CDS:10 [Entrophospora candida]